MRTNNKGPLAALAAVVIVVALVLLPFGRGSAAITYGPWVDEGSVVVTHENVAPGTDTDTARWIRAGEPTKHVTTEAQPADYTNWSNWNETQSGLLSKPSVPANTDTHEWLVTGPVNVVDEPATNGTHYSWNGGNRGVNDPPTVVPPHADWQVQGVGFDPHLQGNGDPATWYPIDPATSGLHVVGNSPSNASWFYYVPGAPEVSHDEWGVAERTRTQIPAVTEVSHLDYPWQKQVRSELPTDTPTTPPVTPETPTETPITPVETPEVPVETPATPEAPESETPVSAPAPEEDPVISKHTSSGPDKTVVTYTHESGAVTKETRVHDKDAKEEGL